MGFIGSTDDIIFSTEIVATPSIRELLNLSYQTFVIFPACLIYSLFVVLSIFFTLSIFRRLIKLLSVSHLSLSIHFLRYLPTYKCTHCTHHIDLSLSCFVVRTLSALIQFPNSPGVFGPRAILLWGGSRHGWGLFS